MEKPVGRAEVEFPAQNGLNLNEKSISQLYDQIRSTLELPGKVFITHGIGAMACSWSWTLL